MDTCQKSMKFMQILENDTLAIALWFHFSGKYQLQFILLVYDSYLSTECSHNCSFIDANFISDKITTMYLK